jgi:hypothetical protein
MRQFATGTHRHNDSYVICRCGSWNTSSLERCYSCRRAIYADMEETECASVVPSADITKLRTVVNRARLFIARKLAEIVELERKSFVVCLGTIPRSKPDTFIAPGPLQWVSNGCGAEIPIATLAYIQTHWYTEPSGCTGGDYWSQAEGQFKCPECGVINRLYIRHDVEKLKPYFAKVDNVYNK